MPTDDLVPIRSDADIVAARQCARVMAAELGFGATDLVLITTAVSELARNILLYARDGQIAVRRLQDNGRCGILIEALDQGPGIPNLELAMQGGYSTSGNLGLGLPGVRRLMDEMGIESKVGVGTKVTAKKWNR